MKNESNSMSFAVVSKLQFWKQLNEGDIIEWLSRNGKNALYALVALIALIFILYQFSSRRASQQEADYIKAANQFYLFSKGSNLEGGDQEQSLTELLSLMGRHPELHAAYDGEVAQALLNEGDWAQARPLALATLKRTQSDAFAAYRQFAETSLLVSQNKFEEALTQAQALQKQMKEQFEAAPASSPFIGMSELFALNLLRIGMLQQQLGDTAGELKTWHEWKQYAGLELGRTAAALYIDSAAFRTLSQLLAQGSISLPDYFAYRQQQAQHKFD